MPSAKRKLIFLWTYVEWGGAQIYFIGIIKEALPDWEVFVILPRSSRPDIVNYLDQLNVKYEYIDARLDLDPVPTFFARSNVSFDVSILR